MRIVRYTDRPDLLERRQAELSAATFPAYMHESEPGNRYWGASMPTSRTSRALVAGDELLAEAHTVPLPAPSGRLASNEREA